MVGFTIDINRAATPVRVGLIIHAGLDDGTKSCLQAHGHQVGVSTAFSYEDGPATPTSSSAGPRSRGPLESFAMMWTIVEAPHEVAVRDLQGCPDGARVECRRA